MATMNEYALMAGASYISSRGDVNLFAVPEGWLESIEDRSALPSGFEATYFTNGTEIVISYAGTYATDLLGDIAANVGLATGAGSVQLLQAVEYYLQVKAANPNATIILTGHSLGGGLAALVGVFFRETANTFDEAPFANSASYPVGQALLQELLSKGYSASELSGLSDFLSVQQQIGGIPNSNLVTNVSVQGEFLTEAPWTVFPRIGYTTEVIPHWPLDSRKPRRRRYSRPADTPLSISVRMRMTRSVFLSRKQGVTY